MLRIAREKKARVKVKKLRERLRKVIIVKTSSDNKDKNSKNLLDYFIKKLDMRRRGVVLSYIKI